MKAIRTVLPFLFILSLFADCKNNTISQIQTIQNSTVIDSLPETKPERSKINLKDFNLSKLDKDTTIIKGDSILKFSNPGTLRVYTKNSHTWLYRKYSNPGLKLYSEKTFLSNIPITTKFYDEKGLLTREITHLTNTFSPEDLIKLFQENFNIDINKKTTESLRLTTGINNQPDNYEVHLRIHNDTSHYRSVIVDANNGTILSDTIEPFIYCMDK